MTRLALALALALSAASMLRAQPHFVILGGLGGEERYAKEFAAQAGQLATTLKEAGGDAGRIHVLQGGQATKSHIEALFGRLKGTLGPGDALVVVLIGHGTFDGREYRFNIPGPDLTASQLKTLLDALPTADQLIVNTTSASGAMIEGLTSDRRVVVAATKSGGERTITVFPRYWLEALKDPSADTDKNETITALEAFRYAEGKIKEFYESEQRLATEHARLEGKRADLFVLARIGSAAQAASNSETRPLLKQRDELERAIGRLREHKGEMQPSEYEEQLQTLLVDLARLQARIDAMTETP